MLKIESSQPNEKGKEREHCFHIVSYYCTVTELFSRKGLWHYYLCELENGLFGSRYMVNSTSILVGDGLRCSGFKRFLCGLDFIT